VRRTRHLTDVDRMASQYRVAAGDTYPDLARRFYRDAQLATMLAAANRLPDAEEPPEGLDLVIPYVTQRHLVDAGDSLFDLAELYYGNGAMFPILSSANHLAEPHLVRTGQVLLVPDLVRVSKHTVYPGDTLREFAIRWYNDERSDQVIAYANRLTESELEVGKVILRPGLNRRHRVEAGETWTQLSQWWYGDPTLDVLIATANHREIADPPPAGHVLFFPDLAEF
jgi:nucleoid-associated protein YgaU